MERCPGASDACVYRPQNNNKIIIIIIIIIIDQTDTVLVGCVLRHLLLIVPVILLDRTLFENNTKQKTKSKKTKE